MSKAVEGTSEACNPALFAKIWLLRFPSRFAAHPAFLWQLVVVSGLLRDASHRACNSGVGFGSFGFNLPGVAQAPPRSARLGFPTGPPKGCSHQDSTISVVVSCPRAAFTGGKIDCNSSQSIADVGRPAVHARKLARLHRACTLRSVVGFILDSNRESRRFFGTAFGSCRLDRLRSFQMQRGDGSSNKRNSV